MYDDGPRTVTVSEYSPEFEGMVPIAPFSVAPEPQARVSGDAPTWSFIERDPDPAAPDAISTSRYHTSVFQLPSEGTRIKERVVQFLIVFFVHTVEEISCTIEEHISIVR